MFVLWSGGMYLYANKGNYWIAIIPATFMSAVICTYILVAQEGLQLSTTVAYPAGIIFAILAFCLFWKRANKIKNGTLDLADKPVEG